MNGEAKRKFVGETELTDAETTVIRMIVGGMSNKEIAFALDVSDGLIETHVQNILAKMGAPDRTSVAATAIGRGLIGVDL